MGNGDLGVCITGPPESQDFWVTKNDFWWLRNGTASPLNFGMLRITAPALSGASYQVRQSLANATTTATFTGPTTTLTESSFVAATANVLVVTLSCVGDPVDIEIALLPTEYGKGMESKTSGNQHGISWVTRAATRGVEIPMQATVAWKIRGANAGKFTLKPGSPVTILLAMATRFDDQDTEARARKILESADLTALDTAHKGWWRDFYAKSFVEIPDPVIMQRYYLSQYLMGSASRNKNFPPSIIGPWATARSGWCGYWMNYNHAAPFYALYSSNHIEQADPQDAPILEFKPIGEKYATEILDKRGVLYPVGIGPLGINANDPSMNDARNDKRYEKGITTWGQRTNAAYNLVNMGQRWYTTYDPDYGRKIYPYMLGVVDFWEDYLTLEGDRYVINDDSVQEGTGDNKNPIAGLGLVRYALHLALDMSKELGTDQHRRAKWQDILDRLSDYPTRQHQGKPIFILTEQGPVRWQSNTCHIQHIYPAGQIGLASDPKLLAIARDTLASSPRWNDGNGSNSFFPMAARIGYDPAIIYTKLGQYPMGPNGFVTGNLHGIENCSTVPNTVNEMLMQSHEGIIRFFPVWPTDKDARFGTLRAHGAFLISAEMKQGVVRGVKIFSEKGRDCTVQNPWPGKSVKLAGREVFRATVSLSKRKPAK